MLITREVKSTHTQTISYTYAAHTVYIYKNVEHPEKQKNKAAGESAAEKSEK